MDDANGLLAVEELPDGLVVAGDGGVVTLVNGVARRLLGPGAVPGRPLGQVVPLADREGRVWWDCVRPWDSLPTVTGHPERTLLLPDGAEVLVAARYVRERPLGPVARVVITVRSGQARAREDRGRAELVSTVAHELRSPLTSVKGFTATLLKRWDRFSDEQKRLMLETVEADADRVTRLITELLDTARIDSGRLAVNRVPVDLAATVDKHVAALVVSGYEPERFRVAVEGPLPELWADRDKLDQVIGNLLENALRHGEGLVTIGLRGLPDGGTALEVRDEGDGVDAEMRQRVFTKFWRSGRHGGTGLGLFIVRGLVEAHGGRISIRDGDGGGALFAVELPSGVPDLG
ncbi:phospho-acceptor domain-containing protein [Motilibacter rhizosphaerae]|uniref:histidine kinase n=1 Tax=Motilibacter rhizosphaerae TaxID=598652 RepID=A0A4Q7NR90_9ACTN|nr:ATP-binding protein [Motilibacter rhizosphaerae]RZS89350.1 phospho-acceptor domain-containing protein [Motilibacter rhizosphaerae]